MKQTITHDGREFTFCAEFDNAGIIDDMLVHGGCRYVGTDSADRPLYVADDAETFDAWNRWGAALERFEERYGSPLSGYDLGDATLEDIWNFISDFADTAPETEPEFIASKRIY